MRAARATRQCDWDRSGTQVDRPSARPTYADHVTAMSQVPQHSIIDFTHKNCFVGSPTLHTTQHSVLMAFRRPLRVREMRTFGRSAHGTRHSSFRCRGASNRKMPDAHLFFRRPRRPTPAAGVVAQWSSCYVSGSRTHLEDTTIGLLGASRDARDLTIIR